ncbi:MAG: hypothetical protein WC900_10395 [Oscillospiraceae bacterium]|jgi:hypothetical protein
MIKEAIEKIYSLADELQKKQTIEIKSYLNYKLKDEFTVIS